MRGEARRPPAVSVLMAVYNGQDHVRQAIEGILAQSLRDFEFIIVDDGSTDRTSQILDEYADPRIVRLRHPENRGLIAALNTGLAAARGEFVARQDADDFSYPDRFRAQVDFLRARPDIALAGSSWDFEPEDGERRTRTVEPDPLRLAWMLLFYCPLPHCSIMFRRQVIQDLGGYGAGNVFVEDFALWSRVVRSHRVANLEQTLVVRRRPPGSITARHSSEMGRAARRISLQNLEWIAGSSVSAAERDALQYCLGNQPLPLAEALGLETRELRSAAERLFQEFWAKLGGTPAERRGFRRWAFAWMGSALLRKGLRLRNECARHSGRERIAGLRLARALVWDAVRMNPRVISSRRDASEAFRTIVSRGRTMDSRSRSNDRQPPRDVSGPRAAGEPPHIVHIVGTLGAGGVQRLVLGLATSPAGRAYRHSVLCLFGTKGSLKDRFEEVGLPYGSCRVPWPETLDVGSYRVSRWLRRGMSWTFPARLARELERQAADLVHTHVSYRIDRQADGAIRRARRPLIWTIHGQYKPEGAELERWRRATRLVGAVTAVAEDLARDFRGRGLDHPDGVHVTRGGVDLSAFSAAAGKPRDPRARARWGIPAEAVVFGASGRLVPEKAYEIWVRAAGRLVAEGADAHFVIAGGGPLRRPLEAEIARAGLKGRFHLIGFQSDVPGFLRELDVFVLSSRFEGFPLALVEALAAGLPCIATPVGGVGEMVGENGALIVPPGSEDALADAMKTMLSPEVRASYAARGPKLAERFSIDRTAEKFAALYDRLLAPGAAAERSRRKVNER